MSYSLPSRNVRLGPFVNIRGMAASPVGADGKLFFLDMDGTLTVVKAGGEWEVLHSLALDEGGTATQATADGRLYVRTHQNLYCFGE